MSGRGLSLTSGARRREMLDRLRRQVNDIEKRAPRLDEDADGAGAGAQGRRIGLWDGCSTALQGLHEVRFGGVDAEAADYRAAGAALGFAFALAAAFAASRPGRLLFIEKKYEAAREGTLYAPGLAALGHDARSMAVVRAADDQTALWAMEEASRRGGVGAIVALLRTPGRTLDLTATRRLHLSALGGARAG